MFFVSIQIEDKDPIVAKRGYHEKEDSRIAAAIAKDVLRRFMSRSDLKKVKFELVEKQGDVMEKEILDVNDFQAWKDFYINVYQESEENAAFLAAKMCRRCGTWEDTPNTDKEQAFSLSFSYFYFTCRKWRQVYFT